MTTVDGRIFDTDLRWAKYCRAHNIKDPFKEERDHSAYKRYKHVNEHGQDVYYYEIDDSPEEKAWQEDWKKRRDEYLRLDHAFRAWDCHFWMDWEQFERFFRNETYTDMSIYLPCDCANRQCSMTCAYFGEKCPRESEELKCPIPGLEGRYEI